MKKKYKNLENFQCHRCGSCCTGDGFVRITPEELSQIAAFLGISEEEMMEHYAHRMGDDEIWLRDGEGEKAPCIFLEWDEKGQSGCRIQPVKPSQCAAFPMKWRREGIEKWCAALRAPLESK